jgi:HEAT repeat protein
MGLFGPSIRKMQANADIGGLAALLSDTKYSSAALDALTSIGKPAVDPLVAMLTDEHLVESLSEVLTVIGEPAIDPLVAALHNPDSATRKGALTALYIFASYRGTPRVFPAIRSVAADDPSAELRTMAADMSTRLDMAVSSRVKEVSRVLDGIEADDEAVRRVALRSLARTQFPEVSLLIRMAPERESAKDALVLLGTSVIEPVTEAMQGDDPDIKKAMAHVLMLMDHNRVPGAAKALHGSASDGSVKLYSDLYDWYKKS